jgi:hypothetical protein
MTRKITTAVQTATTVLAGWFATAAVACADATLQNPLNPAFNSIPNFIAGALKVLVMVALPIISLYIVYSGYIYLAAQGNPGEISKAHKNFMYVLVGSLLILGAWTIATMLGATAQQIVGR